jgi:hypothetical protein
VVEITEKLSIPDFVEEADALFAGIAEEYSAMERLALRLLTKQEADGLEHTVLLQCGIAWQHYHAILLLLANRLGVQGLVLCRTLFELVVATLYLLKNPGLLPDFLDYGKLVFYKHALAVGLSESDLAPIKPECENIRSRFKKAKRREWHGSKIDKLAEAVELGEMYKMFYPDASAATHSDATKTLSHGARGWNQSLRQFIWDEEPELVRYLSFELIGRLFCQANEILDMGHHEEANVVAQLRLERAKSAAMPN